MTTSANVIMRRYVNHIVEPSERRTNEELQRSLANWSSNYQQEFETPVTSFSTSEQALLVSIAYTNFSESDRLVLSKAYQVAQRLKVPFSAKSFQAIAKARFIKDDVIDRFGMTQRTCDLPSKSAKYSSFPLNKNEWEAVLRKKEILESKTNNKVTSSFESWRKDFFSEPYEMNLKTNRSSRTKKIVSHLNSVSEWLEPGCHHKTNLATFDNFIATLTSARVPSGVGAVASFNPLDPWTPLPALSPTAAADRRRKAVNDLGFRLLTGVPFAYKIDGEDVKCDENGKLLDDNKSNIASVGSVTGIGFSVLMGYSHQAVRIYSDERGFVSIVPNSQTSMVPNSVLKFALARFISSGGPALMYGSSLWPHSRVSREIVLASDLSNQLNGNIVIGSVKYRGTTLLPFFSDGIHHFQKGLVKGKMVAQKIADDVIPHKVISNLKHFSDAFEARAHFFSDVSDLPPVYEIYKKEIVLVGSKDEKSFVDEKQSQKLTFDLGLDHGDLDFDDDDAASGFVPVPSASSSSLSSLPSAPNSSPTPFLASSSSSVVIPAVTSANVISPTVWYERGAARLREIQLIASESDDEGIASGLWAIPDIDLPDVTVEMFVRKVPSMDRWALGGLSGLDLSEDLSSIHALKGINFDIIKNNLLKVIGVGKAWQTVDDCLL